jgi:phospholipid/cholesterol/gamma-HCH transport system substrate-binding protein
MNNEMSQNIRLGLFVLVGMVLLIVGLYFIGSNRNMFSKTFTLYATFKDVNGLREGNNVRYAGIDIGTIDAIDIVNDTTIRVTMLLKQDLQKVIRKNSLTNIGTDGLMGDKLINIEPGTSAMPLVNENDELISLPTVDTEAMLRTLEITNRNILTISSNLKTITQNITDSRGTLYTVLMDTTVAIKLKHTLNNIDVVSNNILQMSDDLGHVVTEVKTGKGLLATLIKDTVITNDLSKAVKEIKSAGILINTSATDLRLIMHNINTGNGTISTLVNDTASANSLKRSLDNIEVSTQKFSENMEALKHNFLFKGYFKKQEKQTKATTKK